MLISIVQTNLDTRRLQWCAGNHCLPNILLTLKKVIKTNNYFFNVGLERNVTLFFSQYYFVVVFATFKSQRKKIILNKHQRINFSLWPVKPHLESCNITPDENISVTGKYQNSPKLLTLEAFF